MSAKGFCIVQDGHFVDLIRPVNANSALVATRFNMVMYAHASIVIRMGAAGGPIGGISLKAYPTLSGGTGNLIQSALPVFMQNATVAPFDMFTEGVTTLPFQYANPAALDVAGSDIIIELDAAQIGFASFGTYVELNIAAGSLATSPQMIDAFAILSGSRYGGDQAASAQV